MFFKYRFFINGAVVLILSVAGIAVMDGTYSYSELFSKSVTYMIYFNFALLTVGAVLFYNRQWTGLALICLAAFPNYLPEFYVLHNIFSVSLYVCFGLDAVLQKQYLWAIAPAAVGGIQGIFYIGDNSYPAVLILEVLGLLSYCAFQFYLGWREHRHFPHGRGLKISRHR
jgi:hypothetical protein